jgi:hypothetical protein
MIAQNTIKEVLKTLYPHQAAYVGIYNDLENDKYRGLYVLETPAGSFFNVDDYNPQLFDTGLKTRACEGSLFKISDAVRICNDHPELKLKIVCATEAFRRDCAEVQSLIEHFEELLKA